MPYATVADVRAAIPTPATDADIQAAIDYATAQINARTGRTFGQTVGQVKVFDVRGSFVPLYSDYKAVTAVSVGNRVLPTSAYEQQPYGLRLNGYVAPGSTVTISATFGEPVSPLLTRATVLLAADRLKVTNPYGDTSGAAASVVPDLPPNVSSFSVEGLSVSFDNTQGPSSSAGTGNSEVDSILALLSRNRVGFV